MGKWYAMHSYVKKTSKLDDHGCWVTDIPEGIKKISPIYEEKVKG